MQDKKQAGIAFQELVALMDTLRVECPWDKKQTIQSLQKYTIEELYELMDAINDENMQEVKEELGDVLFHTVFYSRVAEEANEFTITDVIKDVHGKLVRRHPHVFGDTKVANEEEVKKNWEQIKLQEGKRSILQGVPRSLPAMIKAFRIQEKVKQVGFDWEKRQDVWSKVKEELKEFETAENDLEKEQEFGDVLFSLINYARFVGIDPETALEKTNQKFIKRFQQMEKVMEKSNQSLANLSFDELDTLWNRAKKSE